jgi:putative phage-type endonuclease
VNAVPLPDFKPGSPEWMKRMTASKVAAVLGLSPWESRFSLWHRMAGLIPGQPETDQTRRGHYLEGAVADWFADQHPEWMVKAPRAVGFAHPEREWQAASPDRIVYVSGRPAEDAVLEIKTTAVDDEWGAAGTDEIPPYYRAQVVWQLDTLGLSTAYVAVLLPRLEFREYRIDYNADEAAYIRAEARDFLDSLPGGPNEQRPNLDEHAETYNAVKALNPEINGEDVHVPHRLAREFCQASKGLVAAKARYDLARVELADLMGNGKYAVWLEGQGDEAIRHKLADRRGTSPYMQAASAKNLPDIPEEIAS